MLKWVLRILLALLVIVLLVVGIGASLPRDHVATRSASFQQPPELVWKLITGPPDWRPDVRKYQILPAKESHRVWQETDKNGDTITYEEVEATPPQHLVTRIADPKLPFGGTWTYEIKSANSASTLTITENSQIYNPVYRFVSRFIIGYTASLDAYMNALHTRLGSTQASAAENVTASK